MTNAKTNISPRHYFPALLSHLSRGLLPRPLFAPRGRPRGSTSTERQKPFSPPVFHPSHSPPHTPLLLLRAIATRFNCHRRAKIPTGWICVPCPVPTRLLPTQMPPGRRPCRFFFDYGCIQLKKKKCINLCADAKFERHHAWRPFLCTNPKAQMKIPVCVKKKMLKNPMNVEAGINESVKVTVLFVKKTKDQSDTRYKQDT